MKTNRLISTLLAAGAIAGAAAPAASADSVAYIKDGNVWLTTTDASRQFQVTTTGGYSAVSQADDGTLLGTAGGDLVRLDRLGNVLSDIKTPVSDAANGIDQFYGPFNADISPDGKTAAYGYVHSGWYTDSQGYTDFEQRNGAGFTSSTALTGFTDAGYKYSSDWDAPEFIDDHTVLVSNGPGYPSDPFAIETVGSGDPQGWFTDPNNMHPLEATLSRNKRLIAAVAGPDRHQMMVYRDQDAQPLGPVNACFTYTDNTAKFESPTFNADGTLLFWSDGTQMQIAPIGDMSSTCANGINARAAIPGATSPDWGPADVPTSRPAPSPGPSTGPGTQTPPATQTTPAPGTSTGPGATTVQQTLTLARVPAAKLGRTLRRGVDVAVTVPAPGTVTVTASAGRTIVARGTARATSAGQVLVHLTFTRAARLHLSRRRALTLTLNAGQGPAQASGSLQLHR